MSDKEPRDEEEAFEFGPYRLEAGLLLRDGTRVPLTPKLVAALTLLVRRAGRIVTREEISQELWPDTFVSETNLAKNISMLRKVLDDTADEPRYIETLARVGYRFVAPVARAVPGASPAVAAEAAARPIPRKLWAALGVVVVLGVAGFFAFRYETKAPSSRRPIVAVLGFQNLSSRPEKRWLSTALSEMFGAELAAGERVLTIPGEDVARAKLDLGLPDADTYGRDTLAKVRGAVGADFVLVGSYLMVGDPGRVRVDLRLQDAKTAESVLARTETGDESDLFALVERSGAALRERLHATGLSEVEIRRARASFPTNPEALRLLSLGVEKLRLLEPASARDLLEKAAALTPENPMVHASLSFAFSTLGYEAKAKREAGLAYEKREGLSRQEQLGVEARYFEAKRSWEEALDIRRALFRLFPEDLDLGLKLAADQTEAGQPRNALRTIAALRALPEPAGGDPRIDLAEAAAASGLTEYLRAAERAGEASRKARAGGRAALAARADTYQGFALTRLGKRDEAAKVLESARATLLRVGDRAAASRAGNSLGILLNDRGDFRRAEELLESCRHDSEEIGDRKGTAWALANLGNSFYGRGDGARARPYYERSLAIDREIEDSTGTASMLLNLSNISADDGDRPGAVKLLEEAAAFSRRSGEKTTHGSVLTSLAQLCFEGGDLARAQTLQTEALTLARAGGYERLAGYALHGLGDVALARGDLAEARARYREALTGREKAGEKGTSAESRLALARGALEEGKAEEAVSAAR
ncbi:MAG TPA: tetratricopeptide repeat protein, partial [Thermoanaerobaculia bacterium]|nr:tetratricopeptide repeat protein [Thermoanaerobaculia bacterium]